MIAGRTEPESPPVRSHSAGGWHRLDSAGDGLGLDLGLYAVSAVFAAVTAATSTLAPHRAWGAVAAWGYAGALLATLALLAVRHRAIGSGAWAGATTLTQTAVPPTQTAAARAWVAGLAWAAVAFVPLVAQAVQRAGGRLDRAQEEVIVVERAGQRLVDTGTPYLDRAAIEVLDHSERLLAYVPYQPGMALFGLPRALAGAGWWTDARVWFALATAACLGYAIAFLRRRGVPAAPLVRAAQAATVLPICALTLATGGDDIPVLALCLLALALASADRLGAAGLAAGAAGALKLFAWPFALVLAVYALRRGAAGRYLAGALGLPVLALLPAALVSPGAAIENVLRFPLGLGLATSPAQSPFPGYLIANTLPAGRAIAAGLLVVTGIAIAGALIRRPPATAGAVATWTGYGLLAAILLLPSTRFGYLLYPIAFGVWAPVVGWHDRDRPVPD